MRNQTATVVKKTRLAFHKGTSHKFYNLYLLKFSKGYKLKSEHGRIGGYETANSRPKKGYMKVTMGRMVKDKEKAILNYKRQLESKIRRGYEKNS